jgi:hypothetical protein
MAFVDPVVQGGMFKLKGEVISVNLLELKKPQSHVPECHAVAHIKPDAVALRVIKKLHGQMFRGRRVALREYVVRDWRNDRRVAQAKPEGLPIERRRLATRRRNLPIEIKPLDGE